MDAYSAESSAWRIRELAQDIAADALTLALAANRDAPSETMVRLLKTIRKQFAAVEKAADQFEEALGPVQPVDPRKATANV